jgi:hypothetical protein
MMFIIVIVVMLMMSGAFDFLRTPLLIAIMLSVALVLAVVWRGVALAIKAWRNIK